MKFFYNNATNSIVAKEGNLWFDMRSAKIIRKPKGTLPTLNSWKRVEKEVFPCFNFDLFQDWKKSNDGTLGNNGILIHPVKVDNGYEVFSNIPIYCLKALQRMMPYE